MRSTQKWKILADHWTVKLGIQTAGRQKLATFGYRPILTQLHFGQWCSLLFCLPTHQSFHFSYCA